MIHNIPTRGIAWRGCSIFGIGIHIGHFCVIGSRLWRSHHQPRKARRVWTYDISRENDLSVRRSGVLCVVGGELKLAPVRVDRVSRIGAQFKLKVATGCHTSFSMFSPPGTSDIPGSPLTRSAAQQCYHEAFLWLGINFRPWCRLVEILRHWEHHSLLLKSRIWVPCEEQRIHRSQASGQCKAKHNHHRLECPEQAFWRQGSSRSPLWSPMSSKGLRYL